MPIEVWEAVDAPEAELAKQASASTKYWATGSDVEADVVYAVAAAAPFTIDCGGKLAIRSAINARRRAEDFWEVSVKYTDEERKESEEDPEESTWRFSFDTTGGTHKITQSLATTERYHRTSANPAPDLRGAIGWDGKKLNGCEIVIPKLEFTVEIYYDPADLTTNLAVALARNTGKTNNAAWLNFAECEVLFMGATGDGDRPLASGQRVKPAKVVFKFACSENRTSIPVGDIALKSGGAGANVDKKGWEYLWVYYTVKDDGVDGISYPTPEWAYVERVYPSLDFATFFGVS